MGSITLETGSRRAPIRSRVDRTRSPILHKSTRVPCAKPIGLRRDHAGSHPRIRDGYVNGRSISSVHSVEIATDPQGLCRK